MLNEILKRHMARTHRERERERERERDGKKREGGGGGGGEGSLILSHKISPEKKSHVYMIPWPTTRGP